MNTPEPNWNDFALTKADPELAREIEQSLQDDDRFAADSSQNSTALQVATLLLATTPEARPEFQQQLLRQLLGKLETVPVKEASSSATTNQIRALESEPFMPREAQISEDTELKPIVQIGNIKPAIKTVLNNNPKNLSSSTKSDRQRGNWWQGAFLVAASLVVLLVGFAVVMLVIKDTGNEETPTPQAAVTATETAPIIGDATPKPNPSTVTPNSTTTTLSNKLNLQYPSSTAITLDANDEAQIFPQGRPAIYQDLAIGGFQTSDSYTKVPDYYLAQFKAVGYTIVKNTANTCDTICARFHLQALRGTDLVNIFVLSPDFWGRDAATGSQITWYSILLKKLKAGQTFILYLEGPASNAAQNPYLPTPVATVSAQHPLALPTDTLRPAPAQPTPLPTPKPLTNQAMVYVGPDNQFHAGNGLVSTSGTNFENTNTDGVSWKINYLLSDDTQTCVVVTLVSNDPNKLMEQPEKINPAIDFYQFGYAQQQPNMPLQPELKTADGQVFSGYCRAGVSSTNIPSNSNQQASSTFPLSGPPLDANKRSITFSSGQLDGHVINKPVTLSLQSFDEAKLPQVKANPNAVANVNGLKLLVPFAYFGKNKTLLDIKLEDSTGEDLFGQGKIQAGLNITPLSVTFTDNKNRAIAALSAPIAPNELINNQEPNSDHIVALQPLPADAKSLTIKIPSFSLQLDYGLGTPNPQNTNRQNLPNVTIPLDQNGQSGAVAASLEMNGFKVQVISATAQLDYSKQNVVLTVRYQLQAVNSQAKVSYLEAVPAFNGSMIAMANQRKKISQPSQNTVIYEATVTLAKSSSLPSSVQMTLDSLYFAFDGPWQVQLNR